MKMKSLIRPRRLRPGECIGIFTPSSPFHTGAYEEKFRHGISVLKQAGFSIKLGPVTASGRSQGYRSASPKERAEEILELFADSEVRALISTVGGYNTSSIIDHLDFELIAAHPKIVCGYSDVTSLHCSLMTEAGLATFYGPAVFPSFGEWPTCPAETMESFLDAVSRPWSGPREMKKPKRWSRHFRSATDGSWRIQPRQWNAPDGWKVIRHGLIEAPVVALNLNTLLTHAGTTTFPDLSGCILILEDMDAPLGRTERSLVHLSRLGVFEKIVALLWGRVENPDEAADTGSYMNLLQEFVPNPLPIITDVDIAHTVPILTIGQGTKCRLDAPDGGTATLTVLEPMTTD